MDRKYNGPVILLVVVWFLASLAFAYWAVPLLIRALALNIQTVGTILKNSGWL